MSTTALALLMQVAVSATQVTVGDGEEVTIPVAPTGVTVQLPDFVRVVTPSGEYVVKPLAPPAPPPRPGENPAQRPPEKMDIRVFLIRPAGSHASEQPITFVLADGKSVTARLVPGTVRDDSFIDLRWARRTPGGGARGHAADQFLGPERALLLAMLRNEKGYGLKVVNDRIDLPEYPELEVARVRSYESDGLNGNVYTFTNKSSAKVIVNPTVLAVGRPNRAILTQMDHEELRPCSEDNSPDPRGTGCMSVVRIVSRADHPGVPGLLGADRNAAMPYVIAPKDDKR